MSGRLRRGLFRAAALLAAVPLVLPPAPPAQAVPAVPAGVPPGQPVSALLTRLRALYLRAEEAAESYRAIDEKLRRQRAEADRIDEELADARIALDDGRNAAGRLAREQYRGTYGGPFSPALAFLLTADARQALDRDHLLDREAVRRAGVLARLSDGERRTAWLASRARDALNEQLTLAAARRRQRDTVRERLSEVERLLASLTGDQLAELRRAEERDTDLPRRRLLTARPVVLPRGPRPPAAPRGRPVAHLPRAVPPAVPSRAPAEAPEQ
ncbi:hypothetical protein AB0K09_11395 [Streptomyces sp. NPDC049577]|uniref:coiled-coil domain-containing protein n=1 Tax=Streptomyces sp. NPDC049577 TaxID=3155153 RepID=UPI00341EF115